MKTIFALILALFLVGCGTNTVIKKEIVTVDKPIPYVPKPPVVPTFDSLVDKLTDEDIKDPGKVGQAYKYDMMFLRKTNDIMRQILQQYNSSSLDFDKINEEITKIYADINKAEAKAVEDASKK